MKILIFNSLLMLTAAFKTRVFYACLLGAFNASAIAATDTAAPAQLDTQESGNEIGNTTGNTAIADESPMMLYLVPWNANPDSGKNGKKFSLYQPWGTHFDPLTPEQTIQLNAQ